MKTTVGAGLLLLVLAAFVPAVAPAGEGSYEDLVKNMLGNVEQITKILSTIRDEGSATAAKPQLKETASKLLELRKQADERKQPNKEEKDRLAKEYAPKFEVAVKKLREQTIRVKGIPGGDAALEELAVLKDLKDKDKKDGK
jgi:hypothetical protein